MKTRDELDESRAEYLDSWRIAPLLGLSGFSRLLQKQDRTQNTGNQVRRTALRESYDPDVVDELATKILKQNFRVHKGHPASS